MVVNKLLLADWPAPLSSPRTTRTGKKTLVSCCVGHERDRGASKWSNQFRAHSFRYRCLIPH